MHRDLKPENFLIGLGENERTLYLIDYGLAKKYIVESTGEHIKYAEMKKFVGAPRYASLAAHKGIEQGRRDDLESIGYILIYLFTGFLQWQSIIPRKGESIVEAAYKKKAEITIQKLCNGIPGK